MFGRRRSGRKVVTLTFASALLGVAPPKAFDALADAALQGLAVAANWCASSPLALALTTYVEADVPVRKFIEGAASL